MSQLNLEVLQGYISDVNHVLAGLPLHDIVRVVKIIQSARENSKRVFVFGNGGSASTASHFVTDLAKGTIKNGKPGVKALALNDNVALLTAWANDTLYENIFSAQLENLAEPGDIAIGISSSGKSLNVMNGIKTAKTKGAFAIGLTGFDGGEIANICDDNIIVKSDNVQRIEDAHLIIAHMIFICLREGN